MKRRKKGERKMLHVIQSSTVSVVLVIRLVDSPGPLQEVLVNFTGRIS